MSKLDQLMHEYCVGEVPYRSIAEIGTLKRGKRFVHADVVDDNGIPCIHYGELYTYYGVWTTSTRSFVRPEIASKLRYAHKNDVIIVGAGENDTDIGIAVAYLGDKEIAIHDACYIWSDHSMNPKYLSYCLRTENYHNQIKKYVTAGKICAISAENIGKAIIPVPPIEIQDEIVRILDDYSDKNTQLISELDIELEARKKQLDYYRSQLFSFDISVPHIALSQIASFKYGYTDTAKDKGSIRFIRITDINDLGLLREENAKYIDNTEASKEYVLAHGDLVMARTGATFGKTLFFDGNEPSVYASFLIKISFDPNQVINKFYWHFSKSMQYWQQANEFVSKAGQQQFNTGAIGKVQMPLPPIKDQEIIVKVLDRLEGQIIQLCECLRREKGERQAQFTYYRDKILSFS